MDKRILNIMLDKRRKNFEDKVYHRLGFSFIRAINIQHLLSILKGLHMDSFLNIWIHLGASKNPKDPAGLILGNDLIRKYPLLKNKIIYVTSNPASVNLDQQVIGYNKIAEYAEKTEPFSLRELLAEDYRKIQKVDFRYINEFEDWRVWAIKKVIHEEQLSLMLGAIIGQQHQNFRIQVLTPGYSGAYVLRVICDMNGNDIEYLLKISRDEQDMSKEHQRTLEGIFRLLPNHFIGAYPYTYTQIAGWHGLLFKFETGTMPLRIFLQNHLDQPNICIEAMKNVWKNFAPFEKMTLPRLCTPKILPYSGGHFDTHHKPLHYTGLQLNDAKTTAILNHLESLEQKIKNSTLDQFLHQTADYQAFKNFIQNNHNSLFKSQSIESQSEWFFTPLSVIHGDFHSANILIDQENGSISFIDFANTPSKTNKHALLDLAKLSTDMEINILPNQLLINDPAFLIKWIAAHQSWMEGNLAAQIEDDTILSTIYAMNDIIKERLCDRLELSNEPRIQKEILRQFYMIRLHYFLKIISYDFVIREKMIFLIQASISILNYLIRK